MKRLLEKRKAFFPPTADTLRVFPCRRMLKVSMLWLIALFGALLAAGLIFVLIVLGDGQWLNYDPSELKNISQNLTIYGKGNEKVCTVYTQSREYVKLSAIPQHVIDAFLTAEDQRFYEHRGIDVKRIAGALITDIKNQSLSQGASTITQQLIKNTYLSAEKTWTRKIKEAWLSIKIEQRYSKDEILEMYLNSIYFGNGAYGIEAAAKSYFGLSVRELSVSQGAVLAAVIKGPSLYAPHLNPERCLERRNLILKMMAAEGEIESDAYEKALQEELILVLSRPDRDHFGYYIDAVMAEARQILQLESEELIAGGYSVFTYMDASLQKACEDAGKEADFFPENAADGEKVQCAVVVLDAQTGEVQALIGGRDYTGIDSFNRATSACRSPGSALKPLISYALAIEEENYLPISLICDEPVDYEGYSPGNASGKYYGTVTLRYALAHSLNVPAVKLLDQIGVSRAKALLERMGIHFEPQDGGLALALGGMQKGVTPLSLAGAYTTLAAGGTYSPPAFIEKILDNTGRVIYQRENRREKLLSTETAFLLSDMLQDTVKSGTAQRLKKLDIPLCAKTGTVDYEKLGNRDAWLAAYNKEVVALSWMGFDKTDNAHFLASSVTGGTYNAELLCSVFSYLYPKANTAPSLTAPKNLTLAAVDRFSLFNYGEYLLCEEGTPQEEQIVDYFNRQTLPKKTSTRYAKPMPCLDLRVKLQKDQLPHVTFTAPQEGMQYDIFRISEDGNLSIAGSEASNKANQEFRFIDQYAPTGKIEYYIVTTNSLTGETVSSDKVSCIVQKSH